MPNEPSGEKVRRKLGFPFDRMIADLPGSEEIPVGTGLTDDTGYSHGSRIRGGRRYKGRSSSIKDGMGFYSFPRPAPGSTPMPFAPPSASPPIQFHNWDAKPNVVTGPPQTVTVPFTVNPVNNGEISLSVTVKNPQISIQGSGANNTAGAQADSPSGVAAPPGK
jgi:hypothetical protein